MLRSRYGRLVVRGCGWRFAKASAIDPGPVTAALTASAPHLLVDDMDERPRRLRRSEQAVPMVVIEPGKARLRDGRHFGEQRGALRGAHGERERPARFDLPGRHQYRHERKLDPARYRVV